MAGDVVTIILNKVMRMTIKYNEDDLLELFWDFPKVIDEEAEIYEYSYRSKTGHKFSLYMSTYEDTAILTLEHEELKDPIISFELDKVDEIKADQEKLTVVRSGEPFVQVYIRPGITMKFLLNYDYD